MSASEVEQPEADWEQGFEEELTRQRRIESMLMLRGATILIVVSVLVVIRSILL